jgi:hypothetical protein
VPTFIPPRANPAHTHTQHTHTHTHTHTHKSPKLSPVHTHTHMLNQPTKPTNHETKLTKRNQARSDLVDAFLRVLDMNQVGQAVSQSISQSVSQLVKQAVVARQKWKGWMRYAPGGTRTKDGMMCLRETYETKGPSVSWAVGPCRWERNRFPLVPLIRCRSPYHTPPPPPPATNNNNQPPDKTDTTSHRSRRARWPGAPPSTASSW